MAPPGLIERDRVAYLHVHAGTPLHEAMNKALQTDGRLLYDGKVVVFDVGILDEVHVGDDGEPLEAVDLEVVARIEPT